MDRLADLPPTSSQTTPQESAVMDQLFGPSSQVKGTSRFNRIEWKLLGATVLLFTVLANPWIDQIICKVPYCGGSQLSSLATKIVLFTIILAILFMFL